MSAATYPCTNINSGARSSSLAVLGKYRSSVWRGAEPYATSLCTCEWAIARMWRWQATQTTMAEARAVEELPESRLGTKEHWDSVYEYVIVLI